MSVNADIDYKGFLFNVLTSVGLGEDSNSICELIDNSIDANSTNIKIQVTSNKDTIVIDEDDQDIKVTGPFLIISDNGTGLNNDKIKKLLTLCTENKNNNHNGKFGIGAVGSFSNINKHLYKNNKTSYTLVLSENKEVILDFNKFYHTENKSFWKDVSGQNISNKNKKIFDKYKIENNGTVIVNTIDIKYISNLLDKLKYKCILHYYNHIKKNLEIEFNDEKNNWVLNKDTKIIDLTGEDRKNNMFTFKIYTNETNHFYAEFDSSYMKMFDKKVVFSNFKYAKIKPINISGYYNNNLSFTNKLPEDINISKYLTFKIIITEPYNHDAKDVKLILFNNSSESFQGSDYNGLYIERNGRILAKPFDVESIRQTQEGVRFRSKIIYNSDDFDYLFPVQINKSQINSKNINKGLYRLVSLLSSEIYKKNYLFDKDKFKEEFFNMKNKTIIINTTKITKPKKVDTHVKKKINNKSFLSKSNSDSNISIKNNINTKNTYGRKQFTSSVRERVLTTTQECRDPIFKTKLDKIYNPYEYDHIDGDNSNNDESNCQALTLLSHYLKTHPKDKFEKIKNNENEQKTFLIEHINKLLQSSLLENNIYFENNQIFLKKK